VQPDDDLLLSDDGRPQTNPGQRWPDPATVMPFLGPEMAAIREGLDFA
jgi:hypothetical protein